MTCLKSKLEVLQWAYDNRLFFIGDWKDVRREANTAINAGNAGVPNSDPVQAVLKAGLANQSDRKSGVRPHD